MSNVPFIILFIVLTLFIGLWIAEAYVKALEDDFEPLGTISSESYGIINYAIYSKFPPTPRKYQTLGTIAGEIIQCESGGKHYDKYGYIIRGQAGEYGIAQYMPESWEYFNKLRGTDLDLLDKQDQLNMLEWCLENDLGFHWTCFKGL